MPFAWKITVTGLGLGGFAALAVRTLVLQAMFWRMEPAWTGVLLSFGTGLIVMVGVPTAFAVLVRRWLRPPATFTRAGDGAAFVVPGSPVGPGFQAILLMLVASYAVPFEKVPGTDRIGLPGDPALPWLLALPALPILVALAIVWLPGTGLRLTPAGITVRRPLRTWEIGWDELLPGGPHPARRWSMRLLYRGPGARPRSCRVPMSGLAVDAVFLATVVRHYAERAEHRAGIGTEAELERLRAGFARWSAAGRPAGHRAARGGAAPVAAAQPM
ncbi:hypothetical protein [Dactylosporangium matsuzakiense]|uniref:PH (Pleckstrin Homology) domain-containing protein n=1 Tax=Dactylosporangium matsuzakiense TaxID=53360 RepID=A0A9W6KHV6_9ACTN|nr:hypothetical protein [Dactylosporangium matsuzakiense]UWZ42521.1 hypothetical protein Dmats_33845 [Dactylosporangium matsuzakiense]GLL00561.1 hypothetical protein GCM10017581_023020 [Dactylosporangium matsuzakiense]